MKFNNLTILALAWKTNKNGNEYRCLCRCGKVTYVFENNLVRGKVKSCGCLINKSEKYFESRIRQSKLNLGKAMMYIGKIYGKLTITDVFMKNYNQHSHAFANCDCDCGNTKVILLNNILRKITNSCDCLGEESKSLNGSITGNINHRRGTVCHYKNIRMRSWFEVMWAECLDLRESEWEYEPKIFKLSEEMRYKPDFHVFEPDEWFEVKGYVDEKSIIKINLFRKLGFELEVITLKEIEREHPLSYREFCRRQKEILP